MSRSLYCLVEKAEYNKEKNTTTYRLLSKEGIGDKHNLLTLRDFFGGWEEFIEGVNPDSTPFCCSVPKNITNEAEDLLEGCDSSWYINLDVLEYFISDFFFNKLSKVIKYELGEDNKRALNNTIRMFNDLNYIAYNVINLNDDYCNEDIRLIFYIC